MSSSVADPLQELGGSLGDFGTLFRLAAGYITVNGLEARCAVFAPRRKDCHPILRALAVTDDDGSPLEFEVPSLRTGLDAQAQAFHQAYTAAVDQLGHQLVRGRQASDEARRIVGCGVSHTLHG